MERHFAIRIPNSAASDWIYFHDSVHDLQIRLQPCTHLRMN